MPKPKWKYGKKLPKTERIRSIIRRVIWAAQMAGYRRTFLESVKWKVYESCHYQCSMGEKWQVNGWTDRVDEAITIGLACSDEVLEDTAIHEMAHALLALVESDRRPDGACTAQHSPAFFAIYGQLYHYYWDFHEGPSV